ncbi:protein hairless isoform X2 [Diorhabda sublineata]|uniref:protein hairless isoform X2 n=1 Tax=Diorhabda sublineata TaxID=1163346 RepID=UPI0024E1755F|nr:protein hairless isoform X2 [Diorhabda sublineata]
MHISSEIQHPSTTILTKCTKMSEEGHKFGMNGNVDRNIKEECHKTNYGQGGRLKFFKDGKFILELERAREGERVSWVSVPRKTFWPPPGTASATPAYRQESSTSLSVSDDNSSIQSSPWQRDHSWKQTNPCKNLSKELKFYLWRPKGQRSKRCSNKRRRPLSTAPEPQCDIVIKSERTYVKVKKEYGRHSLLSIVQYLIDKSLRTSTPPRAETVVSPRKRFLREMEKDKFHGDDNSQKRSRNKSQTNQPISNTPPSAPVTGSGSGSPVVTNGVEETKPLRNSSYSITSLLAEDRNIKRSPPSSPSHYPLTHPQYCSPPPSSADDRLYSESVDRLRSIELSQVEKCGYPPYSPQSYLHGYVYPFPPVPSYYGAGVYGRGYVVPSMYHHSSPLHMPIRHETPTCSWTVVEPRRDGEHREDTVTDMPLNLSKNSG